jgi:hypothetical protein
MDLTESIAELLVSVKPAEDGTENNEIRYQVGGDGQIIMWRWDSNNLEWVGHCIAPSVAAGDPGGTVVSDCVNQIYIATASLTIYRSTSEGGTSWQALSDGVGGGGC